MSQEIKDLLATRWSLLARLKDWQDDQSWRQFFDTYWKLIYSVAIQAGLSDAEAQDVVQDRLLSVARKIARFKCHPEAGSFKVWLLKLTRWRILNQLKKRVPAQADPAIAAPGSARAVRAAHRSQDDSTRTATIERVADPANLNLEAVWVAEWARNLTEAASERVRRKVSARQFQMFELYVVQGWPVREVARLLDVSASQVYLAKHRVLRLLKREIRTCQISSCQSALVRAYPDRRHEGVPAGPSAGLARRAGVPRASSSPSTYPRSRVAAQNRRRQLR